MIKKNDKKHSSLEKEMNIKRKGETFNSEQKNNKNMNKNLYVVPNNKKDKDKDIVNNSIVNNSDTGVVSDTSDTGVVSDTSSNLRHLRLVSQYLSSTFGDTLICKVFRYFFTNKNATISIANLSKILGEKKDSIRAAIYRRRDDFNDSSSKGKSGVIQVSEVGWTKIKNGILNLEEKDEFEVDRMEKEKNILLDKLRRAEDLTDSERRTARRIIDVLLLVR